MELHKLLFFQFPITITFVIFHKRAMKCKNTVISCWYTFWYNYVLLITILTSQPFPSSLNLLGILFSEISPGQRTAASFPQQMSWNQVWADTFHSVCERTGQAAVYRGCYSQFPARLDWGSDGMSHLQHKFHALCGTTQNLNVKK